MNLFKEQIPILKSNALILLYLIYDILDYAQAQEKKLMI